MEPGLLLIPGPTPLPPEVLEELAKPAMPHYGDAWVKAHAEAQEMLRYLWSAPEAYSFPVAGPGHAALEAIAYTFLRPGDRAYGRLRALTPSAVATCERTAYDAIAGPGT